MDDNTLILAIKDSKKPIGKIEYGEHEGDKVRYQGSDLIEKKVLFNIEMQTDKQMDLAENVNHTLKHSQDKLKKHMVKETKYEDEDLFFAKLE